MSVVADKNGLMSSFIAQHGYVALFFLAIIESACAPIPSEVTFGFAGALCTPLVAQSVGLTHPFSMPIVILIGTVGSLIGSVIAYEVGRTAGRAIVDRWGKWILLTHKDLDAAEPSTVRPAKGPRFISAMPAGTEMALRTTGMTRPTRTDHQPYFANQPSAASRSL